MAGSPWAVHGRPGDAQLGGQLALRGADVVEERRPGGDRGAGDDGLAGVDRDPGAASGERLDDGDDAPQLFLLRDGGGAGASGLTAHIEPIRPVGEQGPAVGDGRGVVVELPSV